MHAAPHVHAARGTRHAAHVHAAPPRATAEKTSAHPVALAPAPQLLVQASATGTHHLHDIDHVSMHLVALAPAPQPVVQALIKVRGLGRSRTHAGSSRSIRLTKR